MRCSILVLKTAAESYKFSWGPRHFMKDTPSEMISVLNYVLQSATTRDGRRKAALSTELVQIPQGTSFWNSLYSILPLLRSFFFCLRRKLGEHYPFKEHKR